MARESAYLLRADAFGRLVAVAVDWRAEPSEPVLGRERYGQPGPEAEHGGPPVPVSVAGPYELAVGRKRCGRLEAEEPVRDGPAAAGS
jgi:hypothetical protein